MGLLSKLVKAPLGSSSSGKLQNLASAPSPKKTGSPVQPPGKSTPIQRRNIGKVTGRGTTQAGAKSGLGRIQKTMKLARDR